MSLIINGTGIPVAGSVVYNNTNLDKVICNGSTVWEKATDFYIWKDGNPYPSYNPSLFGTTHGKISFTRNGRGWYGMTATNVDNGIKGGMEVPVIATNGRKNVKIKVSADLPSPASGERTFFVLVYGLEFTNFGGEMRYPLHSDTPYDYGGEGIILLDESPIEVPLKGYDNIQVQFKLRTDRSGGEDASGTVHLHVDYIYLYD